MPLTIAIQRLSETTDMPSFQSAHASGMDLHAALPAPQDLAPGAIALVPCGFAMALPEGYEAQVRPRSGLAVRHGISIPNAPGTIDADYRGEVKVALINLSNDTFTIEPNMRIAQLVVAAVVPVMLEEVSSLDPTLRGSGGFGSTGA